MSRQIVGGSLISVLCMLALMPVTVRAQMAGASGGATADWLPRWERQITGEARDRYCDKETGEEIGWLVSPFLEGFYYGYLATHDTMWIDRFVDWSDSWIKRGIKEPDGYLGWPKADGASTQVVPNLYTDNELGDAMGLRAAVTLSGLILKDPALTQKYGDKARGYIKLSEQMFEKWDARGCWREVKIKIDGKTNAETKSEAKSEMKEGGLWVVPEFGIDRQTGQFTVGYANRQTTGFSLPDNKQNLIARWELAMYDATRKPIYKERASKWFQLMLSRMQLRENGKYYVWNYWDPAGPWDYKPDGSTRHWVGVHPNGGYYTVDVEAIVAAYEHRIVFTRKEIDRLIATNRDYMWNREVKGAKFQRIDGAPPAAPYLKTPGVLWSALVPYDPTLRTIFEANHDPASWGGMTTTSWYLALQQSKPTG